MINYDFKFLVQALDSEEEEREIEKQMKVLEERKLARKEEKRRKQERERLLRQAKAEVSTVYLLLSINDSFNL